LNAKATRSPPPPKPKPRGVVHRVFRMILVLGLVFGLIGPILVTALYRFVPPPITYLMVERMVEGRGFDRRWRSLDRISPVLTQAVIAAEDARFCEHRGFDFDAMEKAMAHNQRRPGKIRGGSTISQQTAKNIFLWPDRSYVRKGLEAYFTVLIETLWGKRRIMEVYLNSIEWGPGVYGAEAAAQRNFKVAANKLSPAQAARLAAILPSPLKWKAATPGPYVKRRSGKIRAAAGTVRRADLAACVLRR
jgi:monofunctional biosynthetic peptidoglycan transglycosylase